MMSVTDEALEFLATIVERAQASDGAAVRIVARSEGWATAMDHPRPEDQTFEHEARTVLVLDAGIADRLQGSTLDVYQTPEGPRLKLR